MGAIKKATLEDAWSIIAELAKAQKETDRQLKGVSKSQEETDRQLKGVSKSQEETDRQLKGVSKSQEETDRQLKATDRQLRESQEETAKQLRKTDRRFNTQWGKLIESLVQGDIEKRFSKRGIPVQGTTQRAKKTVNGKQYEFDIIVHNGSEIIVVEVKTTLDVKKVDHFIEKLKDFKMVFTEYADKKIYGAVAFIIADSESDKYSENKKTICHQGYWQ